MFQLSNQKTFEQSVRWLKLRKCVQSKDNVLAELKQPSLSSSTLDQKIALVSDEDISKWIERLAIDYTVANLKIESAKSLYDYAVHNALRSKAITQLAEQYNVKIDEKELRQYIEAEKSKALASEAGAAVIDEVVNGLGLNNMDELFYNYDIDHHTNNYIWNKVNELLEQQYPIKESEQYSDYQQRLLAIFQTEVQKIIDSYEYKSV